MLLMNKNIYTRFEIEANDLEHYLDLLLNFAKIASFMTPQNEKQYCNGNLIVVITPTQDRQAIRILMLT